MNNNKGWTVGWVWAGQGRAKGGNWNNCNRVTIKKTQK